jgi:hypothetical protein
LKGESLITRNGDTLPVRPWRQLASRRKPSWMPWRWTVARS